MTNKTFQAVPITDELIKNLKPETKYFCLLANSIKAGAIYGFSIKDCQTGITHILIESPLPSLGGTAKEILKKHIGKDVVFGFDGDIIPAPKLNAKDIVKAMEEYASQLQPSSVIPSEWISVEERLPEISKTVLITDGKYVRSGWLNDKK
ncbi:MAG TPA: hypothetical protein VEA37_13865, partial [Flavobacterium sp.]|nr:hypothetical protein [Flavobacterium sp.]